MDSNALLGWLVIISVPVGLAALVVWFKAHTWSQASDEAGLPPNPIARPAKFIVIAAFAGRFALSIGESGNDDPWVDWATLALTVVFLAAVTTWFFVEKQRRENAATP